MAFKNNNQRGFTLFELLVSIGIFTMITTIVLIKNSEFKGNILVTNLAYQIALAVREAQVYGINVASYNTGTLDDPFSHAYGIHFDTTNIGSTVPFILFADINDNYKYNSSTDYTKETFAVAVGNSIKRFCVYATSGNVYCSDGSGSNPTNTSLTFLDLIFKRPDPSARIVFDVSNYPANY